MESEIVKWFQSFSSKPLDNVFIYISKFGAVIPFAVIFLLLYWFLRKETAMKYLFITLVGALLNTGIKRLFKRPRPYMDYVDIQDKYGSTGYSFPSGHSLFSTLTFGGQYIILSEKSTKSAKITNLAFSILIVLLVMVSRIYLGQHYLSDVISGALFGVVLLLLGYELFPYIEKHFNFILLILIPLLIAFPIIKSSPFETTINFIKYYAVCGVATGVIVGYLLDIKYINFSAKLTLNQNLIKFIINFALTILVVFSVLKLQNIFKFKLYVYFLALFVLGIFVTAGCSIINKLIFKKRNV